MLYEFCYILLNPILANTLAFLPNVWQQMCTHAVHHEKQMTWMLKGLNNSQPTIEEKQKQLRYLTGVLFIIIHNKIRQKKHQNTDFSEIILSNKDFQNPQTICNFFSCTDLTGCIWRGTTILYKYQKNTLLEHPTSHRWRILIYPLDGKK